MNYLYLCSSPRHIYIAMGLALNQPAVTHHLMIINQKKRSNFFVESLVRCPYPFASVEVMPIIGKRKKYVARKKALTRIEQWLQDNVADKILCGNDRSVEFQFAMYRSQKIGRKTVGAYLDDGTGSYINGSYLKWNRAVTDLTIDRCLKWLFYGVWYHKVKFLGGSKWVQECYLNFPKLAPEYIKKNKQIIPLEPSVFRTQCFLNALLTLIPGDFTSSIDTSGFQLFLVLPLSKTIERFYASTEEYLSIINGFVSDYERVAVKYHPRETQFYFDCDKEVTVFPPELPAEAIFSLVNVACVVGDTSSALLSAHWLNPAAKVVCLCPKALMDNPIMRIISATDINVQVC